jgi:hypothetical protein
LYCVVLWNNRRYDDAWAARNHAKEISPVGGVGIAYDEYLFMKGLLDEQIAYTREVIIKNQSGSKDAAERLALFDRGYAEGGFRGAWQALADYRAAQFRNHETKCRPSHIPTLPLGWRLRSGRRVALEGLRRTQSQPAVHSEP